MARAAIEAVAWTERGFVAVGRAAGPAVWTSTDGDRWTQRSLQAEGELVDVAWHAGHERVVAALVIGDGARGLVAVGSAGTGDVMVWQEADQ